MEKVFAQIERPPSPSKAREESMAHKACLRFPLVSSLNIRPSPLNRDGGPRPLIPTLTSS